MSDHVVSGDPLTYVQSSTKCPTCSLRQQIVAALDGFPSIDLRTAQEAADKILGIVRAPS